MNANPKNNVNLNLEYTSLRADINRAFGKMHKSGVISSIRTAQNKAQAIYQWGVFIIENKFLLDGVDDHFVSINYLINYIDREMGILYLNQLALDKKSTSTLNIHRNAINTWLSHCLYLIKNGKSKVHKNKRKHLNKIASRYLPIAPNEVSIRRPASSMSRTYTVEQVKLLMSNISERNKLSIELCLHCNLRVHELFTLLPLEERAPTDVELTGSKLKAQHLKFFCGLTGKRKLGVVYTVIGKGGLIREVLIPYFLHEKLILRRRKKAKRIVDRGCNFYKSHYDINGGNALSACFTRASQNNLGWSTGIHSLRHDYAKTRLKELFGYFNDFELARLIVSQELGHYRPQVTNTYL
ncbi:hypothetical protein [Colwellia sp. MEBiC06753]